MADKTQEPDVCTPQAYALPPGAGCLGAAHGLYNIVFGQCLTGHQGTALYYEASQAVGQFAGGACAVSTFGGFVNLSRSGVLASEVSKATMCLRCPQCLPWWLGPSVCFLVLFAVPDACSWFCLSSLSISLAVKSLQGLRQAPPDGDPKSPGPFTHSKERPHSAGVTVWGQLCQQKLSSPTGQ